MDFHYATTVNSKNLKMIINKSNMCFDEMKNYIFRLERRALQLYHTLKDFCIANSLERKIFCRLRDRGLYAINYLTLIRLCYGLKLSPNQLMRFEEWDDIPLIKFELNLETLEKIRIDWKKQMDNWYKNKKQKPTGEKRYGRSKF